MTSFAFIREGPSDDGMLPHFRQMLADRGWVNVVGNSRPYRGSPLDCLTAWRAEGSGDAVVFFHKDADSADGAPVRFEIRSAAKRLDLRCVVPVVPVQELEAWLLLSEKEIRAVAGRPKGRVPLTMPKPSRIEGTTSPKEVLGQALLDASETRGRRHERERARFGARRRSLLERLDIHGEVRRLPSWAQFEADLDAVVRGSSD